MFKEIRKKKRELSKEESIEVLIDGRDGVLSTISENGYPYGIAVNYVYYDNAIYFHCSKKGHKMDNIKLNNKVSFFVTKDISIIPSKFTTYYSSVVVFGRAEIVEDDIKRDVMISIAKKYSLDFIKEGIKYVDKDKDACTLIKINIDHMSGKCSDGTN